MKRFQADWNKDFDALAKVGFIFLMFCGALLMIGRFIYIVFATWLGV